MTVEHLSPGKSQLDHAGPNLNLADIQGNVIPGFKQDFQTLLYVHIDNPAQFRPTVDKLSRRVATAEAVRCFRRPGGSGCPKRPSPPPWMNIAFSFVGLQKLMKSQRDAEYFADGAFRDGAAARAAQAGEDASRWKVRDGDGGAAADVLIIVAGGTQKEVDVESEVLKDLIVQQGGATVLDHEDLGQNLGGREHFGYRDGISQPGVRGRASVDSADLLTARGRVRNQGRPGQELIWPGEFVFGYQGQKGSPGGSAPGGNSRYDGVGAAQVPDWGIDGSYLVFRRFEQDVFLFHKSLHEGSRKVGVSPELLGARIVGRWLSGAPITRAPAGDDPALGDDDDANNYFLFQQRLDSIDGFGPAEPDPEGIVCPLSAHTRNAFPRDDVAPVDQQQRRLLRRGITFGRRSLSTSGEPVDDGLPRGLLFLAYMTSISRQFEAVNDGWSDTANVRVGGIRTDALLRGRWIVPTGSGYYFAPSVPAMQNQLS